MTKQKLPDCYPLEVLEETMTVSRYPENLFLKGLRNSVPYPYEVEAVDRVAIMYYLGTLVKGEMPKATTFPFIDINLNIRTIQVKLVGSDKRSSFLHAGLDESFYEQSDDNSDWLKSYMPEKGAQAQLFGKHKPCFFGEHLLKRYPDNPVAIVEAAESAIIGALTLGLPEDPANLLWLAVDTWEHLTPAMCSVLQKKSVALFPGLSPTSDVFLDCHLKARELNQALRESKYMVTDLLERYATEEERNTGATVSEFLLCRDWRKFQ